VLAALRRALAALGPRRRFLAVALPLALFFVWPLWAARIIPLHDLPNHLARITALHYVNDPRWNLSPYYQRSLQLVPYLGHFYLVHLLTYVFRDVTLANRVFMSAYLVSAPLCGLAFARATGRSPWLALFTLPLAVSLYFQWGFISFCAGALLLLPALAALFRLLDEPSRRGAVAVAAWCATLYLFHIVPWSAFGLYACLLLVVELAQRRWRGPLLAVLAMLPSLVMMLIGVLQARSFGYFGKGGWDAQMDTPGRLMQRALAMINLWNPSERDEWIALSLMLLLLLLVVSDAGPTPDEPLRRRLRIPLAFVTFVALAFFTPFWIRRPFNWWMINQRFLLPAALLAIFFPRGALRGWRAALMTAAVAVMLLLPPSLAKAYRDFSRRAEPLIALIEETPLGSNTLLLHSPPGHRQFQDPQLAPEMTYWREMYNYPLVLRGGYDPYIYDDGFPIKRIRALPAPKVERAAELIYTPDEQRFNPATMLKDWDYYIVADDNLESMPVDGVGKVQAAGRWVLLRNLTK
jgi:hypothetical protein